MSEPNRCPECGAELSSDALAGMCPKCLLAAGLESGAVHEPAGAGGSGAPTTPHGAGFVPPELAWLAAHFPQLEILELLGCGGMGAVYKARQPRLDRQVALKIIRPESADAPAFAERFNREARMLARLNHPQIVAVFDFGEVQVPEAGKEGPTRSLYYFLMEYVDGANLRELMRSGELTPPQALAIVPQICEALQFAHDDGVVHRDIKPENILLDRKGRVKIADFGLAKLAARSPEEFTLTGTHQVMGTPRYMAPEQMEGSHAVDHRADIYSLGVVFYEMLTGEVPVGHFEPPSKKVEIDVRLDEVVLRALAREPERRYQHASDVKTDVDSITTTRGAKPSAAAASVVWPYWTPTWQLYAAYSAIFSTMLYSLFTAVYGTSFFISRTVMLATCAAIVANTLLAYWIESHRFDTQKSWTVRHNLVTLLLGTLMLMLPSIVLSPVDLKDWLPAHLVAFTDGEERWLRILALGLFLWTSYFVCAHVLFALGRSIRGGGRPDSEPADASFVAREPERRYQQAGGIMADLESISSCDKAGQAASVQPIGSTARKSFPWTSFWIGLSALLSVLGLLALAMHWTGSAWPLVGLALPYFVLGLVFGAVDEGDDEAKAVLPATYANAVVALAASAALMGYGVILTDSAWPLWFIALCLVAIFLGIGAGATAAESEKSQTAGADGTENDEQSVARGHVEVSAYFMILIGVIATGWLLVNGPGELRDFLAETEVVKAEAEHTWLTLLWCLFGPLVALGGYSMLSLRWYWLAVVGGAACVASAPFLFAGGSGELFAVAYVGAYALWKLFRPEVRQAFQSRSVPVADSSVVAPLFPATAEPVLEKPRGTLRQAWDEWWAERDRWVTLIVQSVLGLIFAFCLIAFLSYRTKSELLPIPNEDGQFIRHAVAKNGLPFSPWFSFEKNPKGELGWHWEIHWISWSSAIMLFGFAAWWANWQIEKSTARSTGKKLRWWDGSPNLGIAIWAVGTVFAILFGVVFPAFT